MTLQQLQRGAAVLLALALSTAATAAGTAGTLHVYGPGGPGPAMQEAANEFGAIHRVKIVVTTGPTSAWADEAKQDADIIFSGAENMMSDLAKVFPGLFELADAEPLFLRPAVILVRPGNPKHIKGFRDLLAPGVKILAVAGSGQIGLWEDVAGRTGDIVLVSGFRRNLVLPEAETGSAARVQWTTRKDIDAWLVWDTWQFANPQLADVVPLEEPFRIYRDTGVVLTAKGKRDTQAQAFIDYLETPGAKAIFDRWGWNAR